MMGAQPGDLDDGGFPPNPFRSTNEFQPQQQQQQHQQQQPTGVGYGSSNPMMTMAPMTTTMDPLQHQQQQQHQQQSHAFDASFAPVQEGTFMSAGAMDSVYPAAQQQQQQQQPQFQQQQFQQQPQQQQQQQQPMSGAMNNNNNDTTEKSVPSPSNPDMVGSTLNTVQSCCSLQTYKSVFDVDTADVQTRIVGAFKYVNVPDGFRHNVLNVNSSEGKGPDLYGPFWITMTLVFLVAVTSNMAMYLHSKNVSYDISHLVRALTVISSFSFLLPFLLFFAFRCLAIQMQFIELVALYGYSLVWFIPATILTLVPSDILVWISLLVSTGLSMIMILRNVVGPVLASDSTQQTAGPVLGSIIGFHFIFFLVLKFTFYRD